MARNIPTTQHNTKSIIFGHRLTGLKLLASMRKNVLAWKKNGGGHSLDVSQSLPVRGSEGAWLYVIITSRMRFRVNYTL